jgi:hypothetical protein
VHAAPSTTAAPRRRSPAAGSRRVACWALALLCGALPASAGALAPFQFDKPPDGASPAWAGRAKLGANLSSGNVQASGFTGEAAVERRGLGYRLQLGGSLAVARTRLVVGTESDGVAGIGPGELHRQTQTTRQAWALNARGDLFTSPHGSLYASASAAGDRPAGKLLVVSSQVGYGLELLHQGPQAVRVEVGYDLSREEPVIGRTLEIHSGRLFLGYKAVVDERLTATAEAEVLTNLNAERTGEGRVARFRDTRLLGRLGAAHKLNGTLSAALRITEAYDAAPSVRPPPPGTSWEPGFAPLAQRLDSTAELLLVATF